MRPAVGRCTASSTTDDLADASGASVAPTVDPEQFRVGASMIRLHLPADHDDRDTLYERLERVLPHVMGAGRGPGASEDPLDLYVSVRGEPGSAEADEAVADAKEATRATEVEVTPLPYYAVRWVVTVPSDWVAVPPPTNGETGAPRAQQVGDDLVTRLEPLDPDSWVAGLDDHRAVVEYRGDSLTADLVARTTTMVADAFEVAAPAVSLEPAG